MNAPRAASTAVSGVAAKAPSIARVYDFLLGGKDNYEADRVFAEELLKRFPLAQRLARQNREFLRRAVSHLAGKARIDQFIDIGAGLPTADNTHEIAQRINPDAQVVYVDHDPLVLTHGRALLAEKSRTAIVEADLRDPAAILGARETQRLVDLSRPAAVLFASVLHFVPGHAAAQITGTWWQALAPGSYLLISHGEDRPELEDAADLYQQQMRTGTLRTRDEIKALFGGFELLPPGLVPVPAWRPADARLAEGVAAMPLLGGVGRRIDNSAGRTP